MRTSQTVLILDPADPASGVTNMDQIVELLTDTFGLTDIERVTGKGYSMEEKTRLFRKAAIVISGRTDDLALVFFSEVSVSSFFSFFSSSHLLN